MKNGVCLSWWATDLNKTFNYEFSFFTYNNWLYTVDKKWVIRDMAGNTEYDLNTTCQHLPHGIQFGNDMYIALDKNIYKIDSFWTVSDVTPSDASFLSPLQSCLMNYANTFLLIWRGNQVWRYDTSWVEKKIREFDSWYMVRWLTQEWNYLKIYTADWINTKIHYAKGTFDVEYTGLIQTVSFAWLSLQAWWVTSDQWTDYAIFEFAPWELKLAKISWYNKTDIRWTQTWAGKKIFTSSYTPYITASDWVVFAATDEWVWTFTEYNWWLWWWCVEFREIKHISNMIRFHEELYVCIEDAGWKYKMRHYDLSFHPAKYQSNWFIIGRVFDWGCAGLFKKNDQATITYNMPVGTSMELSYRYDRSSFWYNKSDFLSIKELKDTNECYDIVVPTTPWEKTQGVLLKENWTDLILLENGNWIWLEELMVCPFNKTWNLLEYRFDLNTTNTSRTPILFEHSLTYYDYMRKYR